MQSWSQKTAFPQVQLEKDILDRAQNDWIVHKRCGLARSWTTTGTRLTHDLLRVRCAGIVDIYLLRSCAVVKRDEAVQEVVAGSTVVVTAVEVWEVVTQWQTEQLPCEEVDLVQEENLAGKPW
jgi:hypothetical protein